MTDASADTRRVVQSLFAAVGQGDRQTALGLVADQVDWGGAGDPSIPWIGPRHSRAEVGDFLDILAANLTTEAFDITDTVVDGQNAVVLVTLKQRVAKTGALFESDIAFHLKVVDGQVVLYRYFEDSLALARAYGTV